MADIAYPEPLDARAAERLAANFARVDRRLSVQSESITALLLDTTARNIELLGALTGLLAPPPKPRALFAPIAPAIPLPAFGPATVAAAPRVRWHMAALAALLLCGLTGAAVWRAPLAAIRTEKIGNPPAPAPVSLSLSGRVEDSATGLPITGARVSYGGAPVATDAEGSFHFERGARQTPIFVKAPGYRQAAVSSIDSKVVVRLEPIEVRALYLSRETLARSDFKDLLALVRGTGSNAVVLGVKSDKGYLALPVDHPLARRSGALDGAPLTNPQKDIARWKAAGIYTICLQAVFKDDLTATVKPDLALRGLVTKRVVRDAVGVAWVNPAAAEVREYNLQVAKAAAAAGFDEILFDFIRFPAEAASQEGLNAREERRRLEVVTGFLRDTASAVSTYNVYLNASMFGSVCSSTQIGAIGQRLEEFASALDYVSPMLYPSSFHRPGHGPSPLLNPYRLIAGNLEAAARRLGGARPRLRPWLQNFTEPPLTAGALPAEPIRAQAQAARDVGASGWMFWNSQGRYEHTSEALRSLDRRKKLPAVAAAY